MQQQRVVLFVVMAVTTIVFVAFLLVFFSLLRTWVQGSLTGVKVSFFDIIGMKLRRSDHAQIVQTAILLKTSGVSIPIQEIEGYWIKLAGTFRNSTELATRILQEKNTEKQA